MRLSKDEHCKETRSQVVYEDGNEWLRFTLSPRDMGVDKYGDVYLLKGQAIKLANKILAYYGKEKR